MEAFNRFASTISSSVSSTVFSTVTTIKDVLPGNPVTRDFEVTHHIASAGPGLIWKVYNGFKKSTKQPAAVFVLEKRLLDRFDRQDRDFLLDVYKKAISQLTRLRHPQILTVQHPLEESRDCLAFATEPVFCSLANILGRTDNMPSPVPSQVRDYKLFDVEIKYGLLQLSEGLAFLHDSVKLLHRNISPESIVINHQGAWKIFGFDFCIPNSAPPHQTPTWPFPEYNHSTPPDGYPDLDFLAPEFALSAECQTSADLFSLGMVAFALYNNKPVFCNSGNWGLFKKNAYELKSLREANLQMIPGELKEYIKMLLSATPELRPTASQFTKISFFEDVGVKTLNNLDSQFQWDNLQKSQFYKGLPSIIPKLPHRVALHRVVPCLAKEFVNPEMVPFVLPTVLKIADDATKSDFENHILPHLRPVMKLKEPVQILLIFMQRMEMLLSKTPPTDVKNDVLPMIYRALESEASQIQELCLSIIPGFAGLLDYQAMKNALLPRIKKLCISTTLLSVRVNSLLCLGKLLSNLDKWLVIDEILPMLQQIPSREPAVVMGIVGIYKMAVENEKLGLTKEVIATKALPFLFPLSIENGLTVQQYNVIMNLIRHMINKVETEHKVKLEQLNSLQDEQRSALQISMSESFQQKSNELVPKSTSTSSGVDEMFSSLGLGSYVQQKDSGSIAADMIKNNGTTSQGMSSNSKATLSQMSLEEKQRIINQTETMKRIQNQPQLAPISSTRPTNPTTMSLQKDLTSSLLEKNLTQMSTPMQQTRMSMSMNHPTNSFGMASQTPSIPVSSSFSNNQWGNFASATPVQSNAQKPDLSAFDSLLSMPSQANKSRPMSMMTPQTPVMQSSQPQSHNTVKLSANDINDLLS